MAGPAQQQFEQVRLARGELDRPAAALDGAGAGVEGEVGIRAHIGRPGPAQEGAHARGQLDDRERLHEVVVGARVEAGHAVVDAVTRREHQDRRRDALRPQPAGDGEPVHPGHRHIEDDRVRRRCLGVREGRPTVGDSVDGVALGGERALEHPPDRGVVLDDEDARKPRACHSGTIGGDGESHVRNDTGRITGAREPLRHTFVV